MQGEAGLAEDTHTFMRTRAVSMAWVCRVQAWNI
jgi:hypothetical protein